MRFSHFFQYFNIVKISSLNRARRMKCIIVELSLKTLGLYLPAGTGFMSLSPIFLELCLIMFGVLYIFDHLLTFIIGKVSQKEN